MIIPNSKIVNKKSFLKTTSKAIFWFLIGVALGLFLFVSFAFLLFRKINSNVVYPGIIADNIDLSGKKEKEVSEIFERKNQSLENTQFVFSHEEKFATISARELNFGYDPNLIARQAISIGRSDNFFSDIGLIVKAYIGEFKLKPAYRYSESKLLEILTPFTENINKEAVNALFSFQDGKVTTFKPSEEGRMVDTQKIKDILFAKLEQVTSALTPQLINIPILIKVIKPKITTDKANNLGIKELIGTGTSLFAHSIPTRVFNIMLAAERINGILVAPNETFSFNKALGDVSSFTGYKQAYIIQNGKTVLGDGGGVCQVSTTFFRSLLNAGLPIVERNAHAYRVSYYEQDSPPGLDATIYVPTVDLKFKNDTNNYILIQTLADPTLMKLSIFLYGASDGRKTEISTPIILNKTPAPEDVYQDDPTLPKGKIKQIDFKAEGARVSFARKVTRDGKEIISEKFISNYAPWRSVFLRGTKE